MIKRFIGFIRDLFTVMDDIWSEPAPPQQSRHEQRAAAPDPAAKVIKLRGNALAS